MNPKRIQQMVLPGVVALSVIVLFSMVSAYLPANEDLSMAVGWLGLDGHDEVRSPMWGEMIRWSVAHLPGSIATRLGVVSAFGGVLCVLFLVVAVERFLLESTRRAKAYIVVDDRICLLLARLGALLAALALLFSPSFFLGATRTGPLTVRLAIPLAAFAVLGMMTTVTSGVVSAYLAVVVGFLAALGGFEGAPGLVAFPFLFVVCIRRLLWADRTVTTAAGLFLLGTAGGAVFAMGDAISVPHVIRSLSALVKPLPGGILFPGLLPFVAFVILPTAVLAMLIARRRFMSVLVRRAFFGVWALAVVVLMAVTFASRPIELGRAADLFVDRALGRLGTAKWIVSDGTWDDFLLLKMPADVRLISFRREHDPVFERKLLAWAKECLRADDDIWFGAELGPAKFLSEWFASDPGAATNCLFVTRTERHEGDVRLVPAIYGWVSERADERDVEMLADDWTAAWMEFAPLLDRKDEPAAGLLKRWFSIQGNSIGAMAAVWNRDELAWQMCRRAGVEVDPMNQSAFLNLGSLLDRGYRPTDTDVQFVRNRLKERLSVLRNMDEARWDLSAGGRLYVDPKVREQMTRMREERRKRTKSLSK